MRPYFFVKLHSAYFAAHFYILLKRKLSMYLFEALNFINIDYKCNVLLL